MDLLSVNGEAPNLAGRRCDAILCVEYRHGGQLVEPVNVAHLCFNGTWHRLYFDYGIVFWRSGEGRPESYDAVELDASYQVVDVASPRGLLGVCLSRYEMSSIDGGARVSFAFENGRGLEFRCVDDITSYHDAFHEPADVTPQD